MTRELILVDENDAVVGYGEKMKTHEEGALHRAFSLFVLNDDDQLLLQRRALEKYHSGGLWANTCCSHPYRGEDIGQTIHERLQEEMGFDCELQPLFTFIYRAELDNGMTEHEFDHVFIGRYNEPPAPNPDEVCEWKWMPLDGLREEMERSPHTYAYWLRAAYPRFLEEYRKRGR